MRQWILGLVALIVIMVGALLGFVVPERPPQASRIQVGVHIFSASDRIFALARDGGYSWVMQLVPWRIVEPERGTYDWEVTDALVRAATYYRLRLIVRVDNQPAWARPDLSGLPGSSLEGFPNAPPRDLRLYATFMQTLAQRYKGQIVAYSIWNEPNLSIEWGNDPPDAEEYTALLRESYLAIKKADPQAIVIAGNLAPTNETSERAVDDRVYLRQMYRAGAANYFDVLGIHAYGFAYPPDDPVGAHAGLNFSRAQELHQIMASMSDTQKPVWVTEFGWTTIERDDNPAYSWQRVSPAEQASYLLRAIEKAAAEWPWMHVMVVWNLSDTLPPSDEKYWFSLLDGNGNPKPAYYAIQRSRKVRHGLLGVVW